MNSTLAINRPARSQLDLKKFLTLLAIGLALFFLLSNGALAATDDDLGNGVCQLVGLLTGKWLFGVAMLALVAAGATLLFGAEMSEMMKKIVSIIAIVGFIVSSTNILQTVFPSMTGC